MSCCSIKRAIRNISRVGETITDPIKEEASRIESKTRAELKRIPDNIDKATSQIKEQVQGAFQGALDVVKETLSQVVSVIPGSGTVKLIGIGIGAIIVISILRRTQR